MPPGVWHIIVSAEVQRVNVLHAVFKTEGAASLWCKEDRLKRLVIELDRENLEYDVQALVKAFFPRDLVGCCCRKAGRTSGKSSRRR